VYPAMAPCSRPLPPMLHRSDHAPAKPETCRHRSDHSRAEPRTRPKAAWPTQETCRRAPAPARAAPPSCFFWRHFSWPVRSYCFGSIFSRRRCLRTRCSVPRVPRSSSCAAEALSKWTSLRWGTSRVLSRRAHFSFGTTPFDRGMLPSPWRSTARCESRGRSIPSLPTFRPADGKSPWRLVVQKHCRRCHSRS
jgi:hypothetical protein